jgi:hypothetical protein
VAAFCERGFEQFDFVKNMEFVDQVNISFSCTSFTDMTRFRNTSVRLRLFYDAVRAIEFTLYNPCIPKSTNKLQSLDPSLAVQSRVRVRLHDH